jgi:hypothetical protein
MRRRPDKAAGEGARLSPADPSGALARLRDLDTAALRGEWERLHRRAPPPDLTRDLLTRGIAHRLQEAAFGGLPPATVRLMAGLGAPARSGRPRGAGARWLKPGTVLVRGWRGQTHTVTAGEGGFEYRGRLYRSLSLVAREITGAHWSGPRFFGLLRGARPAASAAATRGAAGAG